MGMTPAERQARYRQKHLAEGAEGARLNLVISRQAKDRLQALADAKGVTLREALEGLIQRARIPTR